MRQLKTVGLFAGIGGIELGLERAGHTTLELCELDGLARAVLQRNFEGVSLTDDVRGYSAKLRRLPPGTTILTAGFPCQDLSQAGRTAGIRGSKSGLVEEIFEILRRDRVEWLVLENVSFMLHLAGG